MIRLNLEAETPGELHQTMLALLAGTAIAAAAAGQVETAKPAGRGKKTAEPPTAGADAGNDAASAAGTSGTDAGASQPAGSEVTKETLSPKIMSLGQKSGPAAVQELFQEFGAASFSKVPPEQYPALDARLDQLLAG